MDRSAIQRVLDLLDVPVRDIPDRLATGSDPLARALERSLRNARQNRDAGDELPIRQHPAFQAFVARAEAVELAFAAGWSDELVERVVQDGLTVGSLSKPSGLSATDLSDDERASVDFAIAVYEASGRRVGAVEAVRDATGGFDSAASARLSDGSLQETLQKDGIDVGLSELRELRRRLRSTRPHARLAVAADEALRSARELELGPDAGSVPRAAADLIARYHGLAPEPLRSGERLDREWRSAWAEFVQRLEAISRVHHERLAATELTVGDLADLDPRLAGPVADQLHLERDLWILTDDLDVSEQAQRAGLRSARAFSRAPLGTIEGLGVDRDQALSIRDRASRVVLAGRLEVAESILGGSPGQEPPSSQLSEIEGAEALFGPSGGCRCEHCRSILGPVAYFVDLMCFVEHHVTHAVFSRGLAGHPLSLPKRRPDLWTLPLTCDNANTPVPALTIINEVLEHAVAGVAGFDGDKPGRAVVSEWVYAKPLREVGWGPNLPYDRAFDEAFLLMTEAGVSGTQLASHMTNEEARHRMRLGLSEAAWQHLVAADVTSLLERLDLESPADPLPDVAPVDLADAVGVDASVVRAALGTRFVQAVAPAVEVVAVSTDPDAVQPYAEVVRNLTHESLARLDQLVRLRHHVPWTLQELGLVLFHVARAVGTDPAFGADGLATLGRAVTLAEDLDLGAEELCTVLGELPTTPLAESSRTFADRLLNVASDASPSLPAAAVTMLHPALARADEIPDVALTARVRAALGLGDEDFLELVRELANPLGLSLEPDATEAQRQISLSLGNLSLLFRHAVVCRRLNWPVAELFEALGHSKGGDAPHLESLDDIEGVVRLQRWTNDLNLVPSQLDGLLHASLVSTSPGEDPPSGVDILGEPADAAGALPGQLLEPLSARGQAIVTWLQGLTRSGLALAPTTVCAAAVFPTAFGLDGATPTLTALGRVLWLDGWIDGRDPSDSAYRALLTYLASPDGHSDRSSALRSVVGLLPDTIEALAAELPDSPLDVLSLGAAIRPVTERLGVGLSVAREIPSATRTTVEALRGAMRARLPDEAAWQRAYGPIEDRVREHRRDALLSYMIRSPETPFDTPNDVFHHYLLDPLVEGCARTSRLVSATSSVQRYVQRVLLNLERESGPNGVRVPVESIPADEWGWRKNLRLWEANRKIFLWPESWLDPSLRMDKTPLFRAFERALRGSTVDDETIRAEYARYLKGFEELSKLRMAGGYQEIGDEGDVLHLLGVSRDETRRFYYRRIDNARAGLSDPDRRTRWGAWEAVEVQIGARYVSPIVFDGALHVFWVEYVTQPETSFEQGTSTFSGYRHRITVRGTTRRVDGTWTQPRELRFANPDDAVIDEHVDANTAGFTGVPPHAKPKPGYTLGDPPWHRVLPFTTTGPERLGFAVYGVDESLAPVLYELDPVDWELVRTDWTEPERGLGPGLVRVFRSRGPYPTKPEPTVLLVNDAWNPDSKTAGLTAFGLSEYGTDGDSFVGGELDADDPRRPKTLVRMVGARERPADPINGALTDALIDTVGLKFLLQTEDPEDPGSYVLRRAATATARSLRSVLARDGLSGLLDAGFQRSLAEPPHTGFQVVEGVRDDSGTGSLDFEGASGVYLRELFFHIPRLIARSLNEQGQHEAAQQWLHWVFDPTAEPLEGDDPSDRMWRYREFRTAEMESLRQRLTDGVALATYERDPFNPHAIARTRPTAYMKAVFADYVDNLLDWGDSLFARDSREAIGEATTLYVVAQDLLGAANQTLGACPEAEAFTFADVRCDEDSPLLVEVEARQLRRRKPKTSSRGRPEALRLLDADPMETARRVPATAAAGFVDGLLSQAVSSVFCIPSHDGLEKLRARVADRLYKIRHCMTLDGVQRQLALFAPPIDPELLARARLAGVPIADLASTGEAQLPTHRFGVLMGRARSLANLAQSLGSAFRAAMERRDGEELSRLQQVHRANILRLTRDQLETEVAAASSGLIALQRQHGAAEQRRDHYRSLLDVGLLDSEIAGALMQLAAGFLYEGAGALESLASVLRLIPQTGAPTAMTFGGQQLGAAAGAQAGQLRGHGAMASVSAGMAATRAGQERRAQDWQLQHSLASADVERLDAELEAARLRQERAKRALAIHDTRTAQHEEVMLLLDERFSSLDRFAYLADELRVLYREAFKLALDMAKRAQDAHAYERNDTKDYLTSNYWSAAHSGLLAGERLLLDLARLDTAYLDADVRLREVRQTFSLMQLAPDALMALKGPDAKATFTLPEWAFDAFYPGHYRRRIKAVQLTMPCVAGNYANVSASLRLASSAVRVDAGSADLTEVPASQVVTTQVALSTAQADAGVIELRPDDAKYLPFEGAGAVESQWEVALPKTFRTFDYDTISDVLVHVTYTALEDGELREEVEADLEQTQRCLATRLRVSSDSTSAPLTRVFSLRHEFSECFHLLTRGPQQAQLVLGDQHFPFLLTGRTLTVTSVTALFKLKSPESGHPDLTLNGQAATPLPDVEGMLAGSLPPEALGTVKDTHQLGLAGDTANLDDVLLRLDYGLAEGGV